MQKFKSHKTVEAAKIIEVQKVSDREGVRLRFEYGEVRVSPSYMDKHQPKAGGYYVRYDDGYESWSPAETFEAGYSLMPGDGVNFRDTLVFTNCIECGEFLGRGEEGSGAILGESRGCCDRTYQACFSIRGGPDDSSIGFRLTHDKDGPVPSSG